MISLRLFQYLIITVAATVFLPPASSLGHAMPCSLQEEAGRPAELQEMRDQLVHLFQHIPVMHRDYCRMAHLEYKLSRTPTEPPESHLNLCLENAEKALAYNPQSGTAWFLRGLCRGSLGELRGLWASLNVIDPFRQDMETALKLDPSVEGGGPHRALGRMYYELPFFLGGDLEKSIQHLESAVQLGPDRWENHLYLAESYMSRNRYQEAQRELQAARSLAESVVDQPGIDAQRRRIRELLSEVERRLD